MTDAPDPRPGRSTVLDPAAPRQPGAHSLPPRRARLVRAAVDLIAERGFSGTSIARVAGRAGVSHRSFHAEFESLDDCLCTVLDEALAHTMALAAAAFDQQSAWRDGLRSALAAVLEFMDGEPALARVAMVESLAGGPVVLAHRERVVSTFRELVVTRIAGEVPHAWPLAAEGMFASVMGVVHARLTGPEPDTLLRLLAPLMATLMAPFSDPLELELEVSRSEELAQSILGRRASHQAPDTGRWPHVHDPGLPAMLASRRSRRAHACVLFIAANPGASNLQVAAALNVAHPSQISALLSRLAREGILTRRSEGPGRRNAWQLTEPGTNALKHLCRGDTQRPQTPNTPPRLQPPKQPVS